MSDSSSASGSRPNTADFRSAWVLFLAGPVLWALHFMLVYVVAEAACSPAASRGAGGAPGVVVLTLVATAVGAVTTLALAWRSLGRWREAASAARKGDSPEDHHSVLAFGGVANGLLFCVGILFVGVPATVLPPC